MKWSTLLPALLVAASCPSLFASGLTKSSVQRPEPVERIEHVRTTAYSFGAAENGAYPASNAIGQPLKTGKVHSAAADWSRWPLGTRFRVVQTGQEYIVDDIGSAMAGTGTIDLFQPTHREMHRWGVRHVTIEVLEWGCREKSLEVLKPRKKYRHVRKMVEQLEADKTTVS